MDVILITVSEFASEILAEDTIHLTELTIPRLDEITGKIWDLYPGLYFEDYYDIYWQYSKTDFLRIYDYYSYYCALTLMSNPKVIYMVLRDSQTWTYDQLYLPDLSYDEVILKTAVENRVQPRYYTSDLEQKYRMIDDVKREMTGDIMSYAHKDIYYLETKTKSQTSEDLVNLFASPAGRELIKYKPKAKTKYKTNPAAIDFFAFKPTHPIAEASAGMDASKNAAASTPPPPPTPAQLPTTTATTTTTPTPASVCTRSQTRRKSLELYNEAATILGLTCSQTNDCKCIECQCHYFDDLEEDFDYSSSDGYIDQHSLCSIQ